MGLIEWQETQELRPQNRSVMEFCVEKGIDGNSLSRDGLLIFIEDEALSSLLDFLKSETSREHGGVLLGEPFWDPERGQYFANVRRAIPAHHTEGSAVHLQFTSQTWDYIAGFIEENLPGASIIGWFHSHPNLGVFMSGTDRATQAAFYDHPWCVAVVVDPVIHQTGWFAGKDCVRMRTNQVSTYLAHPAKDETNLPSEIQRTIRPDMRALRWLLPASLIVFFLAAGIWLFFRNRFQSGMI